MARTPTATEQLNLELLNQVRLDPAGEFDRMIVSAPNRTGVTQQITDSLRYFKTDMDLLRSQLSEERPVAPLAWNGNLAVSARNHSKLVIEHDQQSHQLPGELGFIERAEAAGYNNLLTIAENVYAYSQDAISAHAGFYLDWGATPTGIQTPAHHRTSMMSSSVTEIGIAFVAEDDPSTRVGPWIVTQHLANRSDYTPQLLGVVIDDADGDDFYDIGEGLGGVTATASGGGQTHQTTTWAAGGYQMELAAGTYEVKFSGGALGGTITKTVTISGENVKLDAERDEAQPIARHQIGTSGNDVYYANQIAETLDGGDGFDSVIFSGTRAQTDIDLSDYSSIESFIFEDGQLRFDFDGNAGDIYRLYRAAYDRTPDTEGLTFWVDVIDNGMSIEEIADYFVSSAEFDRLYGGQNEEQVIGDFYQNIFLREADGEGFAFWVDVLKSPKHDASDLLLFFADSTEGKELVAPEIADGIWLQGDTIV